MFSALRENYDSLTWDSDQKQTAKAYFDATWRSSIDNLSNSAQLQCDQEIRSKESQLTQFRHLQELIINIQDRGRTVRDLCLISPELAQLFNNADKQLLLYLEHPPSLFSVKTIKIFYKNSKLKN